MAIPDHFQREGWQGQLRRVERWQVRLLSALDQSVEGLGDDDVLDYLYAFCQASYHLRDWLVNSGAATKRELEDLMEQTPSLGLCREICNGSKHLLLDARHRSTRIGFMQEYRGSGHHRLRLIAFEARTGGVNYEYVDSMIDDVVTAWRGFCSGRHGTHMSDSPFPRVTMD